MLHWARYTIGYSFDVALSREVVMACNSCETNFQGSQTLVVSVAKSGSRAVLSVGNQGRNIVLIRRILLCVSFPGWWWHRHFVFTRATGRYLLDVPFHLPGEPGLIATYYIWNGLPAGSIAQAQAEYIEIEGRSRSCPTTI
ncbi:MAG TPA: hypothetical protein VGJ76_10565 [Pseudolabrys sp.]